MLCPYSWTIPACIIMIRTPPLPTLTPLPAARPVFFTNHSHQAGPVPTSLVSAFDRFLLSPPPKDSVFPSLTSSLPWSLSPKQTECPRAQTLFRNYLVSLGARLSSSACRLPTSPQRPISTSTSKKPPVSFSLFSNSILTWSNDLLQFYVHADTVSWMARTLSSAFLCPVLGSVWHFSALNFLILLPMTVTVLPLIYS